MIVVDATTHKTNAPVSALSRGRRPHKPNSCVKSTRSADDFPRDRGPMSFCRRLASLPSLSAKKTKQRHVTRADVMITVHVFTLNFFSFLNTLLPHCTGSRLRKHFFVLYKYCTSSQVPYARAVRLLYRARANDFWVIQESDTSHVRKIWVLSLVRSYGVPFFCFSSFG